MKYNPFWKDERSISWVGPSVFSLYSNYPFIDVISIEFGPDIFVPMVNRFFTGLG